MQKTILVLFTCLLGLSLGAGPARADGMVIPTFLTTDYLAVRYHRVTVDIENNHAVTRVEQEFYNPHATPVSGRYLFPVPPEAILSHFQATLDGQRQVVTRQDTATTNTLLYDTVAQRRDPSLLQYADWETLAFDLSLPAGGSRRMTLEYEEVLAPSGGLFRYRYVLSTERYSLEPLAEVSLTVNLSSGAGLASLYSPTHQVAIHQDTAHWPAQAQVTWRAENTRPTEDFELFFAPAESGFGAGWLAGRRSEQDHFLFMFSPDLAQHRQATMPKDIVFVSDRSGSMSGEKIDQARNALHFILGQLNEVDRFSIVGFDHRLSILAETLQPVNPQTLAEARQFVTDLTAEGDTDLEAALQAGLRILAAGESRQATPLIVFLTDGLPTAGVTDDELITRLVAEANAQRQARLHVFGVGYDVNTHLLDGLAAGNGGTVTYVQPGENLEAVLTGFYGQIANPVLTGVTVEFEGLEASELYPARLPDLFQGSALLLSGRYRATAPEVTVRVRGQAAGQAQEYVYRFDLNEASDRDFVPRLWATRRIGELLDRVRVGGESPALVEEIRTLGLNYGLVTPYTTFIIEAQTDGAASAANMALYADQSSLNQASGQTTIQARVQNQQYQQANQAGLAAGANVVTYGSHSLAQIGEQNVDLALLHQQNVDEPVSSGWIKDNIKVDRRVPFGSAEYFTLAQDPALRPLLQSGLNVIFSYQGQIIAVEDTQAPAQTPSETGSSRLPDLGDWLGWLFE
ncbi:MAG: VWA domain-containing protein [Chloroflexota bacterium]